jgi:diguanylate cyclase (GGDEF)-like protein
MSLSRLGGFVRPPRGEAPSAVPSGQLEPEAAVRLVRGFEAQGSGWFWETDRSGRLVYLSPRVAEQLEQAGGPVLGAMLTDIFDVVGDHDGSERTLHFHLVARTSFAAFEVRSAVASSEDVWSISGRPQFDAFGQFRGFVGHGADLTDERRSNSEIKRLALFDSLTGLANRARMRASLDQIIAQLDRLNRPAALFMLDLDRFKSVNDTLGHQSGDALLKVVAQRLERCVGQDGLLGRLGGDEFQIILSNYRNRAQLETLAHGVISALSQPYFVNGTSVTIGCSVGIAIAPEDGTDSESLIRNADLALYEAKAAGRGKHCFFHRDLLTQARSRKLVEDDLRQALALDQLHLVYQPVVSTVSGEVVGYEALLRWSHPTRGLISPSEFIPIAEESGLIDPIGEWVLRTACAAAAAWPRPARVAVNVSAVQFLRPSLPALVANALAATGLAPERLELEITESVFLNEDASTGRMLASLKGIGARLVLDDFGTGYSSLAYLKKAPFDKIKIDQSFVKGAALDPRNVAIIKAVVAIAETLQLETTAEGVETQDEGDLIRSLGCSHIQGFVYGQPVPQAEVLQQLASGTAANVVGLKTSRSPRQTLLRSTRIEAGGLQDAARIRNISPQGMMIDGFRAAIEPGQEVSVEVADGRFVPATVRWVRQNRAGLELLAPIDLQLLRASR